MRKCPRVLTSLVFALPLAAVAEVPVVDGGSASSYPPVGYGTSGAYAGAGAAAPVSAQGELFMQLQQMQQDIAQLRGLVEEQQNEIARLKQESQARYQDLDSRLQGGAAGAPQAPAQNSPADGAINAAGTPAAPAQQAPAASNEPADPAKEKLYYDAAFDLIKAKDFATEITIFNARQHGMKNESVISSEHITNNQAVRNTLLERGIRPEHLPAAEDVKKVERRLASEEKKALKKPDGLGNSTAE